MSADRIDWREITDPAELEGFGQLDRQDQLLIGKSIRALKKRVFSEGDGKVPIEDSFEYTPNLRGVAETLRQAGIGISVSRTRDEIGRIVITPKTFKELSAEALKQAKTGIPQEYEFDPTEGTFGRFFDDPFGFPKK